MDKAYVDIARYSNTLLKYNSQLANITMIPNHPPTYDFTLFSPLKMEEHIDQYLRTILAI